MATIVIDPGHGGTEKIGGSSPNNAKGPTGLLEKTVTLDIGKRMKPLLEAKGHTVTLTRTSDVNLGLADRAAVARKIKAPVFLSIHLNGFNAKAQGTETLLDVDHSTISLALANAVQKRILVATGLSNRGVRSQPLGVLKPSNHAKATACCLVEISFMDVPAEEARLKTEGYKQSIAQALCDGILDHLNAGGLETPIAPVRQRSFEDGFALLAEQVVSPAKVKPRRAASELVILGIPKGISLSALDEAGLETTAGPPVVPPEAQAKDIHVVGNNVTGPGGLVFGRVHKLGLFQIGKTGLAEFFLQEPTAFPQLPESTRRIMSAVSQNEGRIEAINTWDNAHLSAGIYQWTAGANGDPGELAHLLNTLRIETPQAFQTYFGAYGLGVEAPAPVPGKLITGFLTLNGQRLDTAARKSVLRDHLWAYRFWRAAHSGEVRRAQVKLAIDRIAVFYSRPVAALGNRPLSAFISSQVGLAHLLDQHVNRPGHVPKTIAAAISQFIQKSGKADPAKWTTSDERKVLSAYLALRHQTSMTDSVARAQRIQDKVTSGDLSDLRGSA